MTRELFEASARPIQQPGQRRPGPRRDRQPGPACAKCREQLLGSPMVTPYDVFRAYRDQNERVSAKLVEVPVSKFLGPGPRALAGGGPGRITTQYKDVLPDPSRPTPGFKVPRQVQVEILSIDGNALARGIKDKLTEAELTAATRTASRNFKLRCRIAQRPLRRPARADPADHQPFAEVRTVLASRSPRRRPRPRSSTSSRRSRTTC